jgi:hypothetical protein
VDAKRPRALVGRAVNGNGNLHALVRAEFISEIDLRCRFQRREVVPICLLFMLSTLAQLIPAQSATAPVPEANPGRRRRRPSRRLDTYSFENGALFAEHSTESSKRIGIGQVTKLSVFPRLELSKQDRNKPRSIWSM